MNDDETALERVSTDRTDRTELRHRIQVATHDLRSLLGPIAGFAELIACSDDIEQCRRHASRIADASSRLEKLADELADRILIPETPADPTGT